MLERLFYISVDIQCIVTAAGLIERVNPSFIKAIGYSSEELVGTAFKDHIYPDDVKNTLDVIDKLNLSNQSYNFENRLVNKDSSLKFYSWSFSFDEETNLLFCTGRDVTDLKTTENKLNQIQNSLNIHSIVAITDPLGTITDVNDKFCKISGYSKEELIGQNHRFLNSGAHPKSFWTNLWQTISSGKTWSGLIQNKRKNGDYYFVYSILSPIFDSQGCIESYLAIRFDMTNMIKLKTDLAHTIEILNETNSIAKVGGWELDIKSGDLLWSDETFNILEVEKKDDQKPHLSEGVSLFTDDSRILIENALQKAIEFGESYSLEVEAKTAKGNILWVSTNGRPIYKDGIVVKLSGTIQDIDKRKKIELEDELERMKSIQNSKLASLGELSAGVAHEINNPLTIIMGNLDLITKSINDPAKIKTRLGRISSSCDRISKIVGNLKKFSRSNNDVERELICVQDLITEAISLAEFKAKPFQTKLSLESNTDCTILCNEIEIEQVAINLINNAIDATKDLSERWVKLSIEEKDEFVELRFTDSGPGISKADQKKLFDPFFSTKEIGEGTGLGLSISKGIIEDHEGSIIIDDNSPNTCFLIKFKRHIDEFNNM
jgi:PAS domain S-box-containing protein